MNQQGTIPEKLMGVEESSIASIIEYQNSAGLESLTRFEDAPDTSGAQNNKKKKFRRKKYKNR